MNFTKRLQSTNISAAPSGDLRDLDLISNPSLKDIALVFVKNPMFQIKEAVVEDYGDSSLKIYFTGKGSELSLEFFKALALFLKTAQSENFKTKVVLSNSSYTSHLSLTITGSAD